jgi:hypothetical protein
VAKRQLSVTGKAKAALIAAIVKEENYDNHPSNDENDIGWTDNKHNKKHNKRKGGDVDGEEQTKGTKKQRENSGEQEASDTHSSDHSNKKNKSQKHNTHDAQSSPIKSIIKSSSPKRLRTPPKSDKSGSKLKFSEVEVRQYHNSRWCNHIHITVSYL